MMQVSNFAGPKMGGPKNSDCWNTWQLIYTSVLPKMVPPQFLSCRQSDTLDVVFLKTWRQYPRFLFKAELVQDRDCPYGAIQASPQELIQLVAQLPSASQEAKQQGFPRSWSKADGAAPEVFFFFYWKQQQWISMKHPQKPGVFLVAIPVDQEISRDIWMIYIYIYMYAYNYIYYRIYRLSEMGKKVFHGLGNHWRQSLVSCCWESLPPRFCRCPVRPIFRKKTT